MCDTINAPLVNLDGSGWFGSLHCMGTSGRDWSVACPSPLHADRTAITIFHRRKCALLTTSFHSVKCVLRLFSVNACKIPYKAIIVRFACQNVPGFSLLGPISMTEVLQKVRISQLQSWRSISYILLSCLLFPSKGLESMVLKGATSSNTRGINDCYV